jgi:hypothetical protein
MRRRPSSGAAAREGRGLIARGFGKYQRRLSQGGDTVMQVKIYVPRTVEVPSEYLPALAQRAHAALGDAADGISATRGHIVRQAVRDGLLRELDELMTEDGSVDVFCDPSAEIPLGIENRTVKLSELVEALQSKRSWGASRADADDSEHLRAKVLPRRKAA